MKSSIVITTYLATNKDNHDLWHGFFWRCPCQPCFVMTSPEQWPHHLCPDAWNSRCDGNSYARHRRGNTWATVDGRDPAKHLVGCMYKTLWIMRWTANLNWLAGFLPSTVSMVFLWQKPGAVPKITPKKSDHFLQKFLGFGGRWCEKNNSCENLEKKNVQKLKLDGFFLLRCWLEQIPPDV